MELIKFDPTVEELKKIVALTSSITAYDLEDKKQLEVVKKNRISLRDARVAITKKGKEMREEAQSYAKQVIAKEKELVAIIEPEEERLQSIEDEAKKIVEMKRRKSVLPEKIQKLSDAKIEATEEFILTLGEFEFLTFFNEKIEERNERETARIEAEKIKIEEEKNKIAREKEMKEREEKARIEERERMERQEKERKEREELNVLREKEAKEKKEKEDAERLAKETKYQEWLKDNGYCEVAKDGFRIERNGDEFKLFKLIGKYNLE